jgi:hypothetical protein
MSTQVGTLQRPRFSHLAWPAVAITVTLAVTVALIATAIGRDSAVPSTSSRQATIGGTVNNTPTEMRAALSVAPAIAATGTLANTPTEIRGGLLEASAVTEMRVSDGPFGRRDVTPRVGESPSQSNGPGARQVGGDTGAAYHPLP